jgi:acetoin utilization deacetylase AcuC-like enzyme
MRPFIAFRSEYKHSLPDGHRFPMIKYELLPEQLKRTGIVTEAEFFAPEEVSEEDILEAHDLEYLRRLERLEITPKEQRKTGFPHNEALIHREKLITGGSIQAALTALDIGIGFNIAGGTHHAYRNRGEGFCLLNDIAVTSFHLLKHTKVKQILVVDLDVHQGNGTASIMTGEDRVFTFSMHGKSNYPLHKERSDLDIALSDGTDDDLYLSLLRKNLDTLIDKIKPDFVIYQSGVDVLATDKLGRLGLSMRGCEQRDEIVYDKLRRHEIPSMACMGGGYSEKVSDIVNAHSNTYKVAADRWT